MPERVEQKPATGAECCIVCTAAGQTERDLRWRCWIILDGDEAGVKSVTFQVNGENAYGYLKSEKGVHRLVRISPFNAAGKRQTSFVSCDVMPDIEEDLDVEINRGRSADRYLSIAVVPVDSISTRRPPRSVSHISRQESWYSARMSVLSIMNKDKAMQMLKAKLYLLKQQEAEAEAFRYPW